MMIDGAPGGVGSCAVLPSGSGVLRRGLKLRRAAAAGKPRSLTTKMLRGLVGSLRDELAQVKVL